LNHGESVSFSLPLVRSHERIDWKRCQKKWYWRWRKGLFPRVPSFGATDLGTWVHEALELWYSKGRGRFGLAELFTGIAEEAIRQAQIDGASTESLDIAEELMLLGEQMVAEYEKFYADEDVHPLAVEIPLEFVIADGLGRAIAMHIFKPDMIYRAAKTKLIWLMEHKTATSIQTDHLSIDDQARPYGAMAQLALRRAGVLGKNEEVAGIMYNFLRKILPDTRDRDEQGRALNKNGTVSKRQPAAQFVRHPVRMTNRAKAVTLRRLQRETLQITVLAQALRDGKVDPATLHKTPSKSCPRFCPFFKMCELDEEGGDIRPLERGMFIRRNPYDYEDSTEELTSFEMG
jgi:PD-(D/E)XK nuclease superfamily protein